MEPNDAFSTTTINVRLNKEVSKDILKKNAYEIKEDNINYSKLLIFYFLPEMTNASGAWAISHSKSTLELKINYAANSTHFDLRKYV
jgi:hypothetical protein